MGSGIPDHTQTQPFSKHIQPGAPLCKGKCAWQFEQYGTFCISQELRPGESQPGDLFGWSLASWRDQIIVGSPGR